MMAARVDIVDDDADHLSALSDLVETAGYAVRAFAAAGDLLAALSDPPDMIISDLRMPVMDGIGLLKALRERAISVPVVLLTGHGDVAHAVEAIRAGADDFIEKPYDSVHLLSVIRRTTEAEAARREVARLQRELGERDRVSILGRSRAMRAFRDRIAALASVDLDVLITGETGTGKELAARAIHADSARAGGPFVALNCAALSEATAETMLFGHGEGVFAHDAKGRAGKLEVADGGTLMLDEVETMPPPIQAKLLRVLQERTVERIGETVPRPLDIRVVATTKTSLRMQPEFRPDLYFRLAGIELTTPTLREAGEDIPLIFAHYAQLAARRYGRADPELPWPVQQRLRRMAWPGNIRELKASAEAFALGLFVPTGAAGAAAGPVSLADRVADFEAREIAAVLDAHVGNTLRAAETLGIPRRTLNDKMRRYGLSSTPGPGDDG
ncbi:C4-dicarboxylate transport transcriptional regulatory protein DctD [Sulfitobacter sp. THAF37]|uniref:sigma-54-dependent transcriptional regulator n=1 Tax=Sulfitobacter sp. THAF37 TaxID=2587855 RepID=UPI0012A992C4|nr:sigma-54 dependent transcriptional regulator [Sulfitobacter sp. THAF37]QFT58882.1 C4-dicarboxylate transport transcriptional regulatory protein DctD [Sulfitobacter sp. THAF37]